MRGGRFVSSFVGEQFCQSSAIDLLRASRRGDPQPVPGSSYQRLVWPQLRRLFSVCVHDSEESFGNRERSLRCLCSCEGLEFCDPLRFRTMNSVIHIHC
ncbi:MAG: hypothetical protein ACR2KS_11315 [Candidatus Eremiobacter antarcticus]